MATENSDPLKRQSQCSSELLVFDQLDAHGVFEGASATTQDISSNDDDFGVQSTAEEHSSSSDVFLEKAMRNKSTSATESAAEEHSSPPDVFLEKALKSKAAPANHPPPPPPPDGAQQEEQEIRMSTGIPVQSAERDSLPGAFRADTAGTELTRLDPGPMAPMPVQVTQMPVPVVPDPAPAEEGRSISNPIARNDPVATPVQATSRGQPLDLEAASPVEEEEERAKASQRLSREHALKKGILGLAVLAAMSLAIGISLWFVYSRKDTMVHGTTNATGLLGNTSNTEDAVVIPLSPGEYLQSLLPEDTQAVITGALLDNASLAYLHPQAKAYNWLLDDPQFQNYSASRLVQRYAMATLGYALGMEGTREHWLYYDKHECHWEKDPGPRDFVLKTACNRLERIHSLWFYDAPQGTLPPELGLLTSLIQINIANARLSGAVPTQIGYLRDLEILTLNSNRLSKHLPTELGLLRQLKDLRFSNNLLSGPIPSELSELTRLQMFWGLGNMLSGSLPSELGLWPEILGLEIFNNALSGTIPTELGLLTSLGELTLDGNRFTGTVPSELGRLSHLALFFLHFNDLTGSLPTELGKMTSVYRLYTYSNQLTGTLPTELGLLTRMEIANLHDNKFTGSIPSQLGEWNQLWALFLNFNQQTGIAPHEWGDAVQLRNDDAWDANRFSGSLPSTLGLLTRLHYFYVPNGDLTGTIPTEYGLMKELSAINVANNRYLEGTIPLELSSLQQEGSLAHFNISGTAITIGSG